MTLPIDQLATLLRDAAKTEILPRFRRLGSDDIREKTSAVDLVTEADEAAERFIKRGCAELMPNALFVGEEGVAADPALLGRIKDADLAIIVDPIDGTANFAAGAPMFGVMAAVVSQGETVAGLTGATSRRPARHSTGCGRVGHRRTHIREAPQPVLVGGLSRTQNTPPRQHPKAPPPAPPTSSERHCRRLRSTERTVRTIRGGHAAGTPAWSERHSHPPQRGERYVHSIGAAQGRAGERLGKAGRRYGRAACSTSQSTSSVLEYCDCVGVL